VIHEGLEAGRIVLKIQDDAGTEAVDGRLRAPSPGSIAAEVEDVLASVPGLVARPLFDMPGRDLAAMRRQGQRRLGRELADLSQFFELRLESRKGGVSEETLVLLDRLLRCEAVEDAYAAPRPAPPPGDIGCATPFFGLQQGYAGPAPAGIDAAYAVTQAGGDGAGARVCDVEYSWKIPGIYGQTTGHEDLMTVSSQTPPAPIGTTGTWSNPFPGDAHGTAVLGVLAADVDSFGMDGLAPGSRIHVSAANTTAGFNIAAAILSASSALRAGDIILVEMQNFGPNFTTNNPPHPQFGMVPVEYYNAEFQAIRQVTALGIHVVEAAGNGSQDLDDLNGGVPGIPGVSAGDPSFAVFRLAVRDSGAILVGAGSSSVPHSRMWFSNHGLRVGVFAWGENVATLGYGDLFNCSGNPDEDYTALFGGTSSASAIVAAAAASLQGVHRSSGFFRYGPRALRALLTTSGTKSTNPGADRIGRMPDLADQIEIVRTGPQAAHVFSGLANGDTAGSAVAAAGDVDGDGTRDFLIGAPLALSSGVQTGAAYVVSGLTGRTILTLNGSVVGERFGESLAPAGDVNSDGFDDVAVGAPLSSTGGVDAGRVSVFSGATGAALRTYNGATNDQLGYSLANAGDVNGDGASDLIAGAVGRNGGSGAVFIYSGQNGSVIRLINGPAAPALFGFQVDRAGDVNGDGNADVIVGAPLSGGSEIGAAYVYSAVTGTLVHSWSGGQVSARFGASVAGLGDIDGNGLDDVAVASPFFDAGSPDVGLVQVYSGGFSIRSHTGSTSGSSFRFGESLACVGDFNADGVNDYLAGAPGAFGSTGRAELIDGRTGASAPWSYSGEAGFDHFGAAVCGPGDLNGDARADLLVGAFWDGAGNSQAGRATVFLAPPRNFAQPPRLQPR
jgi:hypothetical protein